jgi:hypothetical protein
MQHTLEFATDNANARYIRFVKSSRLMSGKISVTVPGYITYGAGKAVTGSSSILELAARTRAAMAQAVWSLDGPGTEFVVPTVAGKRTNVDTPGLWTSRKENFPYVLVTQFIGVLFDPTREKVLNVTKYNDELVEDGENFPTSTTPARRGSGDGKDFPTSTTPARRGSG